MEPGAGSGSGSEPLRRVAGRPAVAGEYSRCQRCRKTGLRWMDLAGSCGPCDRADEEERRG